MRHGRSGPKLSTPDRAAFVRAETKLLAPPLVPELRLHLAEESIPLWRRTEEELAEMGLPPPFWAFAWAGGQALARHVLDHPAIVAGRRVFDFAAGSGLVAIAARKAGATHVVANEVDDFALAAINLNAAANGVAVDVVAGDVVGKRLEAEVILAGDVCYERDMAARVIDWLGAHAARGATVLIGDPGRAYLPKERLTALARYDVPVTRELEDAEIKRSAVWRLR